MPIADIGGGIGLVGLLIIVLIVFLIVFLARRV